MITSQKQLPPPLKQGQNGYTWTTTPAIPKSGVSYPKISIVTPSYQQGEFLEETIRSVLMQGYPNLDYIIMDGGSSDESVKIIEYYSDFITYWVSEKDEGQSDAINKGFAHTSGEIMGWLNSDDLLLPNALFHIAQTFMSDDSVKAVTGLRKMIDVDSEFMHNSYHGRPTPDQIRHMCEMSQETTYWRREVWEKVGTIDSSFSFAMDYDYWQRIIHADYEFALIPQYIGALRMHDESKSSTMQQICYREMQQIFQRHNISQNHEEALELYTALDPQWIKRVRLLRDMRHSKLSNNALFVVWVDDVLRIPIIGTLILSLHNQYRRLRGRYYDK